VAELTRHLDGCARCREEFDALRDLQRGARALPRVEMPTRDLWSGIESRLVPRPPAPAARRFDRLRPWALLAAALALVLLGASLAQLRQRGTPPHGFAEAQARYLSASAALAEALAADPRALPEATRAVVERNLTILDQAIRESETALAADPGNPDLEQLLTARYEQRLALLRHATDAGRRES
jgi:hypothetical protein